MFLGGSTLACPLKNKVLLKCLRKCFRELTTASFITSARYCTLDGFIRPLGSVNDLLIALQARPHPLQEVLQQYKYISQLSTKPVPSSTHPVQQHNYMEMESEMERGAQSKQNLISKIIFPFFSVPELWTLTCNMLIILYSYIATILIITTTAVEYSMRLLLI